MKTRTVLFIAIIAGLLLVTQILNKTSIAAEEKIAVKLDMLPSVVKPGDKPFSLGKKLLSKLLPEIGNPRLMSLSDLSSSDIPIFLEEGNVFVLCGDFNNDGIADVAFVGKGDNIGGNSFFVIVSIKDSKIVREFFDVIDAEKIALSQKYYKSRKSIMLIFTYGSEDSSFVYWGGKRYRIAVKE